MTPELEEIIERDVRPHVPGAAVAVLRAGEPVFETTVGEADLAWPTPVTPATVFGLGSVTKPMTALTVLTLVRDGLLDLDAPITAYLPDYPPTGASIRLRHLLTHTSGIVNFVTRPGFRQRAGRLDHTGADLVALFAHEPLEFPPGSRYSYSNSGYALLALAIEAVTADAYATAVAERVFAPAGMSTGVVLDDRTIVAHLARGYVPGDDRGFVHAEHLSMTVAGGAGGIACSLRDMTRFARALRDGTIVDHATLGRAYAPVTLTNGRTEGYGYGWARGTYRDRPFVAHAGGIRGYSAIYVHLPQPDITVIVLTNHGWFDAASVARDIVDVVAPQPRPAPAWRPSSVNRTGTYTEPLAEVRIRDDDGRLTVEDGYRAVVMRPTARDTYAAESDPDTILRFHDEDPPACTLHQPFTWTTCYLQVR